MGTEGDKQREETDRLGKRRQTERQKGDRWPEWKQTEGRDRHMKGKQTDRWGRQSDEGRQTDGETHTWRRQSYEGETYSR